jgi:hypothetical protein
MQGGVRGPALTWLVLLTRLVVCNQGFRLSVPRSCTFFTDQPNQREAFQRLGVSDAEDTHSLVVADVQPRGPSPQFLTAIKRINGGVCVPLPTLGMSLSAVHR